MSHIVIAGTGRAGTTLLVEILTHLGEDTGFSPYEVGSKQAGLEHTLFGEDPPYIVKSPALSWGLQQALKEGIEIERVILPIRDIGAVMESRRRVLRSSRWWWRLVHLIKPTRPYGGPQAGFDQEIALLCGVYNLLLTAAQYSVPVHLLHYPEFRDDCEYLYVNLSSVFPDRDEGDWWRAWHMSVRP